MVCITCSQDLKNCLCPDKKERLNALAQASHVAIKWCRKCQSHYAVCFCDEPDFTVMSGGKDLGKGPHKMMDGSLVMITNER